MANAQLDTTGAPREASGHSLAARFIGLWIAWAALLAGAMIVGNLQGHSSGWATAGRMGSSIALVVTAWWAFGLWRGTAAARYDLAIAIGMTLGTIGDFFNAGLLDFIPLEDGTLGGIAAFGLGHIAYIAGCVYLARRTGLTDRRAMAISIVGWQLIGVVAWYFVVMQGTEGRALVWPALPYSLLLAGTAGVTGGLALQNARFFPLALGAALFLASDLILAFGLFRGRFAYQTESVWLTYGPGQMLIVFSVLAAASVLLARSGGSPTR
jgi:hypothetical protein